MHTIRPTTLALLLSAALLCGAPRLASALPGDGPGGASSDEADALFKRGKAAFAAGKMDEAYRLYRDAWARKQTHDIAGNLAQVELALGKKRDAAEHIAYALAHFPPTVQSERREGMKKVLEGLRKDLGVLRIRVDAPEARVSLDGQPLGRSPLPEEVFVEPGSHVIEAALEGRGSARARIEIGKGAAEDVPLVLAAAPAPPPPVQQPPVKQPEDGAGTRNAVLIAGLAVGGAALAAGIALTVVSNGKASDADAELAALVKIGGRGACNQPANAPSCETLYASYRARGTTQNLAIAGYVTAGVSIGGAVLAYALWPKPKQTARSVIVVPVLGPQEQGVSVGGSF